MNTVLEKMFSRWLGGSKTKGDEKLDGLLYKYRKLQDEHAKLTAAHTKLKAHCDQISNRILDLERDQRDVIDGKVDVGLKTIQKSDSIVFVVSSHKSFLDQKMFAQVNHTLRTRCPWLDVIAMIHQEVDIKAMKNDELNVIGLYKLPKDKTEADALIEHLSKMREGYVPEEDL